MSRTKERYIRQIKNRKPYNEALCYSTSGFLVDILEYNGFFVRKLVCDESDGLKYSLDVELFAHKELFKDLLEKNRKRLTLLNLKRR